MLRLENTQKLLDNVTYAWSSTEEIPYLMTVHKEVWKTQQELEVVTTAMKDLPPLQWMKNMGETKTLQGELQKLHA